MRQTAFPAALLVLAASLIGCSGADEGRKNTFPVSGKVTLQGKPLTGATVMFTPNDGQRIAMGRTDQSGGYSLTTYQPNDGAMPGNFTVVVRKAAPVAVNEQDESHGIEMTGEESDMHDAGGGASGAPSAALVPAQYTNKQQSPLMADVKADGDNKFDFTLD